MGEKTAAALPTHTVEEVPEIERICHTCFTGSGVLTLKKIIVNSTESLHS